MATLYLFIMYLKKIYSNIPTSKIKEYIQAKQYKRKCKGGDNGKSCMYLFDLVVFDSFKK